MSKKPSYKNINWTIDRLLMLIIEENSCLSFEEGKKRAKEVFKELNRLNFESHYNTKKYFKNNLPFTYFEDEIGDFLEYWKLK